MKKLNIVIKIFIFKIFLFIVGLVSLVLMTYFSSIWIVGSSAVAAVALMVLSQRCSHCGYLGYDFLKKKCSYCNYPVEETEKIDEIKRKKDQFIYRAFIVAGVILFLLLVLWAE